MELWLKEATEQFWRSAGQTGRFPRDLERAIVTTLPVALVRLPHLWTGKVEQWLADRGLSYRITHAHRPLRGCVIGYRGRALIFVDGTDAISDLRFTLAHEVAHLIVDYFRPRQQILTHCGSKALDVLDGLRPPTREERIDAILSAVKLGVHTHFMDRTPDWQCATPVFHVECRADRLALELLAPADDVRRRLPRMALHRSYEARARSVARLLTSRFKLPSSIAREYGRHLCACWFGEPSVREWLGI